MLNPKDYLQASVFSPENLLREARRQKNLPLASVPSTCLLDPDGDIVQFVLKTNKAKLDKYWACYHTNLYRVHFEDEVFGIIGNAVGAPFAVLLAEQCFASGCNTLISITSAGIINPTKNNSKFILIESSLRDEGTSFHYLPPDKESKIQDHLLKNLLPLIENQELSLELGKSWTTDAPYRETKSAIDYAKSKGVHSVEMESSALYAFALAKKKDVICFAHLTNSMAQSEIDFEKGIENGSIDSLNLVYRTIQALK
ncbi:MAG: nucleoside phosphorylase [Leptospiraceae bacterium]|nr:nucleoside phosphorylase [Leptospiraceae bacterium]MCK6382169.1 nucleoside phosphorylase [Leptospiraceae bacterium]NUM40990.1 nucleoside phosphorylase [Leptospiraceae bacterium]